MQKRKQQDFKQKQPAKKQRVGLSVFENFIYPASPQEVQNARRQQQVLFMNRQEHGKQAEEHPLCKAIPKELDQFAAKHLHHDLDVLILQEPSDDNLLVVTPPQTETVHVDFEPTCTFTLMNVDLHHAPLTLLMQQFDAGMYVDLNYFNNFFFRGNIGGSTITLFACEVFAYFPYSVDLERMIVAIDSPILVCIFEEARTTHTDQTIHFMRGNVPIEMFPGCVDLEDATLQYELEPGDCLYIPPGEVVFVVVSKPSIWAEICLPASSSFESLVLSKLEQVEQKIPSNNFLAKATLLNEMLMAQIPAIEKVKAMYKQDFLQALTHIKQYDIKKMVAEAGGLVRIENFLPIAIANKIFEYVVTSCYF